MEKEFEKLLSLLPECRCSIAALCRGAEYFSVSAGDVESAARELPQNHDLRYKGVRMLLSAYIEEFAAFFETHASAQCEVTVPAPICSVLALQNAARGRIEFVSSAFFSQVMLRGILLNAEPLNVASCSKRRCGLNRMRETLLTTPPFEQQSYQLQFSALCDECAKTGESCPKSVSTYTLSLPHGSNKMLPELTRKFYSELCRELEITVSKEDMRYAFEMYGRLLKAGKRICRLNSRPDREPLWGNSLALAQSSMLMAARNPERFASALELLAAELEDAPAFEDRRRIYCYFIPFLQPRIERRFRENKVRLCGNAAFINVGSSAGFDIAGATAAWAESLIGRASPEKQSTAIAEEMANGGFDTYLTGMFSFDRCLGASVPMQRKILAEKYGIKTIVLNADFWCENEMFGNLQERIDQICMC